MSLRTSRRAAAAAGGSGMAAVVATEVPSVPVAEIRSRKWTKQLKTVGHLTILKWVPDQETPTLALQKGVFKKTKGGRKRQVTGEIGRMTRSVRQHLAAPLELLPEFPLPRNHAAKQLAAPLAAAAAAAIAASAPADTAAESLVSLLAGASAAPADAIVSADSKPPTTSGPASDQSVQPAGLDEPTATSTPTDPMLPTTVQSDEQLEMALDDLPLLDSDEDLPFDSLVDDPVVSTAEPVALPTSDQACDQASASALDESVEHTAESAADDDDDDDDENASSSSSSDGDNDDDDDNASANSGSPMPSPSPQSSPMMSRSPSP